MNRPKLQSLQFFGTTLAALLLALLLLQACSDSTPTSATNNTASSINTATSDSDKVDSVLLDLLLQYKLKGQSAALDFAHQRGLLDANNNVIFTLVLNSSDTTAITTKIQSMGGTVRATYENMLTVAVPLDTLVKYVTNDQARANFFQSLAGFSDVKEIRFVPPPSADSILTDAQLKATLAQTVDFGPDQAVHAIAADALQQHGISGQNIKLGLIDAGFKDYQEFKSYLPTNFTIKDFTVYGNPYGTLHGTASAIAMHQVAPAAQIFAAPVDSWVGFCNALDWYSQTLKVKVVAAVIGWNGFGRGDGTGTLEGCINKARAAGTLVVIAAGNDGYSHYGAMLNPSEGFHKFPNNTNEMKLHSSAGGQLEVVLNWDDWETAPQVDLDLNLLDAQGQVVASSRNVQSSGKPPWENIDFVAKPGDTYYVQVKINKAPRNVNLNIFAANAAARLEFPVAAESVAIPADAAGALTVGATEWYNDALTEYSGQGPTVDGRIKPEITGPTDVINAAYATENGSTFGGTSAATPHVAAAIGLISQVYPSYTATELFKAVTANAKPLGKTVPNNQTGYGRINLNFLLANFAPKPTATPQPVAVPTPKPTATAVAKPPAVAKPVQTPTVFRDGFNSSATGLTDNLAGNHANTIRAGYQNGSYIIQAKNASVNWVNYPQKFSGNINTQIKVTLPTSSAFGGLIFWQSNPNDYYAILINGQAQWELVQLKSAQWHVLKSWTSSRSLKSGKVSNVVQLETQGTDVKISFNGELVTIIKTNGPTSVRDWTLGLAAGNYGSSSADIYFDDFILTNKSS